MPLKSLTVTTEVYHAILDLQRKLQQDYGEDVTVSDTIDFLGHQFFVHQKLLDMARFQLQKKAEELREPSFPEKMLGLMGISLPDDTTCFIKTDIEVPFHWASTRWLLDIEGKNVLKCLSEQEKPKKKGEYKVDIL